MGTTQRDSRDGGQDGARANLRSVPSTSRSTLRPDEATHMPASSSTEGKAAAAPLSDDDCERQRGQSDQARPTSASRQVKSESEDHGDEGAQQALAPSFDELLFDLLFAASLNTYSQAARVYNSGQAVGFIGYFALLWWAWWTQSVFDTRCRRPELGYPRPFKTVQIALRLLLLGAWVGLSSTPAEFSRNGFTNFSALYAVTRLLLVADWLAVILYDLVDDWRGSRRSAQTKGRWAPWEVLRDDWTYLASAASSLASSILWYCVRFRKQRHAVNGQLLGLWLPGIAIELVVQILVEAFGPEQSLSLTVMPERLSLLLLIILGEGFNGVSEQLTKLSPGYKMPDGSPAGGWTGFTILQVCSSIGLIVVLFWGYFRRAEKEYHSSKLMALFAGYLHLILHAASAIIVIASKRLISFINTIVALDQFYNDPGKYLPQTEEWSQYTAERISDFYSNATNPPSIFTLNATDPGLATVLAISSIIQSTDGAQFPSVDAARWLAEAASSFILVSNNGTDVSQISAALDQATSSDTAVNYVQEVYGVALTNQLEPLVNVASAMVNSLSSVGYLENQLFQYKFLFAASAVYLAVDCGIKIIQGIGTSDKGRRRLKRKTFWASMGIRFAFALVLIGTQVVYYEKITAGDGSVPNSIVAGLAICACIQLLELIAQVLLDSRQWWLSAWKAITGRSKRPERQRDRQSRRPSNETDGGTDDDGDDVLSPALPKDRRTEVELDDLTLPRNEKSATAASGRSTGNRKAVAHEDEKEPTHMDA
ncbi:unnamed protein product [Parajaminaea phylloscopi]